MCSGGVGTASASRFRSLMRFFSCRTLTFSSPFYFNTPASRKQLALRIQIHTKRQELESTLTTLQASIEKQTVAKGKKRTEAERLQDSETEMNNLHRIISQLQVRSNELGTKYINDMSMIGLSASESTSLYENAIIVQGEYNEACKIHGVHSPSLRQVLLGTNQFVQRRNNLGYGAMAHLPGKNNLINSAIYTRQYQSHPRVVSPSSSSSNNSSTTTLSILKSKLSHSITISSHLIYPVYCLKFDKTGRYFVTGSDDQTVKIFYLGASSSGDEHAIGSSGSTVDLTGESSGHTKKKKFNYGANMRGAVLVCTLNGHAGVVTDIDVSSDNALLATSSADGDVRVWKLEDGSPVAILRGHKDGANMVSLLCLEGLDDEAYILSWFFSSHLSPFQPSSLLLGILVYTYTISSCNLWRGWIGTYVGY